MEKSTNLEDLFKEAPILEVENHISLDSYLKSANKLFINAKTKYHESESPARVQERESAYILLLRFVRLLLYTISKHKEFPNANPVQLKEISHLKSLCAEAMNYLEVLHKKIKEDRLGISEASQEPPLRTSDNSSESSSLKDSGTYPWLADSAASTPDLRTIPHHFDRKHPLYRNIEDYEFIKSLGEGGFGSAVKMKDKINNQICVVKKVHYQTVQDIKTISLEIQFLRKFSHPNIVKYFTTFVDDAHIYIVMEFCNGGDLGNWIEKHQRELGNKNWSVNKDLLFEWLQMICSAMAYVHNMDILHRDLKPNNILLSIDEHSGKTVPKIADFGLSYELINKSKASTRAGTMLYWSPEIYQNEMPGKPADVYAIGAITYELCMGPSKPATSLLLSEKKEHLLDELKIQYGDELFTLVSTMCLINPEKRPTFEMICSALTSRNFKELKELLKKEKKHI